MTKLKSNNRCKKAERKKYSVNIYFYNFIYIWIPMSPENVCWNVSAIKFGEYWAKWLHVVFKCRFQVSTVNPL